MKNRKNGKIQGIIALAGTVLIVAAALFCYRTVEETIVKNEKETIASIAGVSARSLETTLKAKSNLIYAAFSGDMPDLSSIEQSILKVGEKGKYIPLNQFEHLNKWEKEMCRKAGKNPGEVLYGPTVHVKEGHYALYMTKAVYMNRSIAGYIQIELNLDEVFAEEQALSNLQIGNNGYCIVKDDMGNNIMANAENKEEEIPITYRQKSDWEVVWSYEIVGGTPERKRKLIAYDTAQCQNVSFVVCMIEDYNEIVAPLEKISLYFLGLGILVFVWFGFFAYRLVQGQKEEELLKKELEYEKELNVANEALKNQESLMEKYNHSKTTVVLSGAIAHEFNNLMTPIVLYTNLLEENEIVREQMCDEVEGLSMAVERCEELAVQLLDYSRQGRAKKALTVYNATFAVKSSVNMVERLVPQKIILETKITDKKYEVRGQIGALNQIILNLVTNAIHAIDGKEGKIRIQYGLSTEDEHMIRLVVEDSGKGMQDKVLRRIFEPFFTTKEEGEGTGIGLTVVKRLVEEHGGYLRVTSEVGKGTMFTIDLPHITE